MFEKKLINCVDLDGTLTHYRLDYEFDIFKIAGTLENVPTTIKQIVGEFSNKPEELVKGIINDTSCGLFARIIKASIAKGHYQALTTFNMSLEYIRLALALLGLTENEIGKIHIKNRKSKLECTENKNPYIAEVQRYFNLGEGVEISLIDDDPDNCYAAVEKGVKIFLVPEIYVADRSKDQACFNYLKDYAIYLNLSELDLSISVPSPQERLNTARKILNIVEEMELGTMEVNSFKRVIDLNSHPQNLAKKTKSSTALSRMIALNQDERTAVKALCALNVFKQEMDNSFGIGS